MVARARLVNWGSHKSTCKDKETPCTVPPETWHLQTGLSCLSPENSSLWGGDATSFQMVGKALAAPVTCRRRPRPPLPQPGHIHPHGHHQGLFLAAKELDHANACLLVVTWPFLKVSSSGPHVAPAASWEESYDFFFSCLSLSPGLLPARVQPPCSPGTSVSS